MQPLTTSVCKLGDTEIAYFAKGKGQPVLLVHGITTYSFIWRKIVPLLEKEYQVLGIDLPGCGASSKGVEKAFSIKNHAFLLNDFLEKTGIKKIHLVGHDVGGGVAQIFAVSFPEKLFSITLINSVAYDFWPVQPIIAMRTPIIRQLAMATLDKGALRMVVRRGLYHKKNLTKELLNDFWEPMKTKEGRKAFLHFAASLDNNELLEIEEKLHQLQLPVLVIRGDADPYLSAAISEKLAKNIPKAKLIRIPTGSHFMQEDEPEYIAKELKVFFAAHNYD
jgi:pimeloyl-ACP methyl ester carboxylesterase